MIVKKIIALIYITLCTIIHVQSQSNVSSVFNRLLIFNAQNEMMVVKIENRDFWVTPGLYQTQDRTMKNGLDSIANTYGIQLKNIKLNGTFLLLRDINGKRSTSLRNVFTAELKSITKKIPTGIEKVEWLSPKEAFNKITFPHINEMIKQVTSDPKKVWGGTLLQYRENDQWKTRILEPFYVL